MPEGDEDDRSEATGSGPGSGTTAPASGGAAQGAGGGTQSAPGEGTTDDDVIQIGPSAEATEKGGAGDDEVAKLKDKVGYLQPAYDGASKALKAVQELHPELFGADGKFVGTQHAQSEDDVLHVGGPSERPAAQAPQATPAKSYLGPQFSSVDPRQAVWEKTNAAARELLFAGGPDEQGDVAGAVATVLPGLLQEYGLTPEFLAQRGGGGVSQEQLDQIVASRTMQAIAQFEGEKEAFANRVEAAREQFGPEFLGKKIKFADAPTQTLQKALPRIMKETGTRDPIAAMLAHPHVGPVARKALVRREAFALAQQMIREQGGMQIMETGGGMPGAGNVSNSLEEIGASTERPVR